VFGCGWRLSSPGAERSGRSAEASTAFLVYAARSCTSGLDSGSQPQLIFALEKSMWGKSQKSAERIPCPVERKLPAHECRKDTRQCDLPEQQLRKALPQKAINLTECEKSSVTAGCPAGQHFQTPIHRPCDRNFSCNTSVRTRPEIAIYCLFLLFVDFSCYLLVLLSIDWPVGYVSHHEGLRPRSRDYGLCSFFL
jgi:hypothetical protein